LPETTTPDSEVNPDKTTKTITLEGVALLDRNTIAVCNDNDFDSEESKYDAQGDNIGKGKISQILVISLEQTPTFVHGLNKPITVKRLTR
jgi:hypothetical protein